VIAAPQSGIAEVARCVAAIDVVALARDERVELVVVGPEAPLVAGLADRLRAEGIATFGPGADGARLEGSKAFSKDFFARHGIRPRGSSWRKRSQMPRPRSTSSRRVRGQGRRARRRQGRGRRGDRDEPARPRATCSKPNGSAMPVRSS